MKTPDKTEAEILTAKKGTGTMKAILIHEYGGVEKLVYDDVEVPRPGPDEILIQVYAAGINPVDWKIREGHHKGGQKLPLTLGWDVAGTVIVTGALVTHFKKGDKVFARMDTMLNGGYAEYALTKASYVALAPNIDLDVAAGVPLAAQTAWAGLFEYGNLRSGQKVLIHGASGGVGIFAVQLAKIAGAYVYATTSDENADMVKSLGADEVIDYKKEDFTKKVKEIDLVFDTIGGETQNRSWEVLHKGGILVSTVGADEKQAASHGVIGKSFMVNSNGARLQEIADLIDNNALRIIIDKEFPFEEIKQAHEYSQSGKAKGKIILLIQGKVE